jgi:alpha-D-ribose 1-methylphosphonate 5-phosphate C-P lyase
MFFVPHYVQEFSADRFDGKEIRLDLYDKTCSLSKCEMSIVDDVELANQHV